MALDRLTEKKIVANFLKEPKSLRLASEGKIEVLKINSWGNNPFACGAYYHLGISQATQLYPALTEAVGRVYFASEYSVGRLQHYTEAGLKHDKTLTAFFTKFGHQGC
jgi:monoamine oxidase